MFSDFGLLLLITVISSGIIIYADNSHVFEIGTEQFYSFLNDGSNDIRLFYFNKPNSMDVSYTHNYGPRRFHTLYEDCCIQLQRSFGIQCFSFNCELHDTPIYCTESNVNTELIVTKYTWNDVIKVNISQMTDYSSVMANIFHIALIDKVPIINNYTAFLSIQNNVPETKPIVLVWVQEFGSSIHDQLLHTFHNKIDQFQFVFTSNYDMFSNYTRFNLSDNQTFSIATRLCQNSLGNITCTVRISPIDFGVDYVYLFDVYLTNLLFNDNSVSYVNISEESSEVADTRYIFNAYILFKEHNSDTELVIKRYENIVATSYAGFLKTYTIYLSNPQNRGFFINYLKPVNNHVSSLPVYCIKVQESGNTHCSNTMQIVGVNNKHITNIFESVEGTLLLAVRDFVRSKEEKAIVIDQNDLTPMMISSIQLKWHRLLYLSLNPSNFDHILGRSYWNLVLYYYDWDMYSRNVVNVLHNVKCKFDNLTANTSGLKSVGFGMVNCNDWVEMCEEFAIQTFPTFVILRKSGNLTYPVEYSGLNSMGILLETALFLAINHSTAEIGDIKPLLQYISSPLLLGASTSLLEKFEDNSTCDASECHIDSYIHKKLPPKSICAKSIHLSLAHAPNLKVLCLNVNSTAKDEILYLEDTNNAYFSVINANNSIIESTLTTPRIIDLTTQSFPKMIIKRMPLVLLFSNRGIISEEYQSLISVTKIRRFANHTFAFANTSNEAEEGKIFSNILHSYEKNADLPAICIINWHERHIFIKMLSKNKNRSKVDITRFLDSVISQKAKKHTFHSQQKQRIQRDMNFLQAIIQSI